MKTGQLCAGLLGLVVFASTAQAQDFLSFDSPTTVARRATPGGSGVDPRSGMPDLEELTKILRAVELSASVQTKRSGGDHTLGPMTLSSGTRVDASVRVRRKGGVMALEALDLRPVNGEMTFGGMSISRVTFNSKGEMKVEIDGFPDLTITNIEKQRDGDIKIRLAWMPDITIKPNGDVKFLLFEIGNVGADFQAPEWPPNLENLLDIVKNMPPAADETNLANIVSSVSWNATAVAEPDGISAGGYATLPGGRYEVSTSGQARVVNGMLESVDGSTQGSVRVTLGGGPASVASVDARDVTGSAALNGAYRFSVPIDGGDTDRMFFEFDGDARFDMRGRGVDVHLPPGTRVYAEEARIAGGVDARFRYGDGRSSLALEGGSYEANLNGPMRVEGLEVGGFSASPVSLNGQLNLRGNLATDGGRLVHSGSASGQARVDTNGFVGVMRGEEGRAEVSVEAGSEVRVDVEEFRTYTPLREARPETYLDGTTARGRIDLDLLIGEGEASFGDTEVRLEAGPHRLGASTEFEAEYRGGDVDIRRGAVTVDAELGGDVRVTTRNPEVVRQVAHVNAELLNMRPQVGTGEGPIGQLQQNERLVVLEEATEEGGKRWLKVRGRTTDGEERVGWVSSRFVTESEEKLGGLTATTTLEAGSKLRVDLDGLDGQEDVIRNIANVIRNARAGATAEIQLGATEISMGALKAMVQGGRANIDASTETGLNGSIVLGGGRVEHVGGSADIEGTTTIDLESGAPAPGEARSVRMTFRLDLEDGSVIRMNPASGPAEVAIKGEGSHISFEATAMLDATGRPMLSSLENVNARIELGDAAIDMLGRSVTAPGEKVLVLKDGRIAILENGLDFFGELSIAVRSSGSTPALSIRW